MKGLEADLANSMDTVGDLELRVEGLEDLARERELSRLAKKAARSSEAINLQGAAADSGDSSRGNGGAGCDHRGEGHCNHHGDGGRAESSGRSCPTVQDLKSLHGRGARGRLGCISQGLRGMQKDVPTLPLAEPGWHRPRQPRGCQG